MHVWHVLAVQMPCLAVPSQRRTSSPRKLIGILLHDMNHMFQGCATCTEKIMTCRSFYRGPKTPTPTIFISSYEQTLKFPHREVVHVQGLSVLHLG